MPKPWERYQKQDGPWSRFERQPSQSDKASQPGAEWSAAVEADMAEQLLGTSTFADMTGSGIAKAVPFADEVVSALNAPFRAAREWWQGEGFDVARAYDRNMQLEAELQRRRQERSPIASAVGSIAGGLGATSGIAKGASFLQGAKPTVTSMAGRGAAEGAAYGAAYGAGEGRGLEERAKNAAWGAGLGAATGALTGAVGAIGASKEAAKAAPSVDDLRAAGQAAYDLADSAGVVFTPNAVDRLKSQVQQRLVDMGYDPALQPGAAAVWRRLEELTGQNVTLKGLDTLRKVASNGFVPGNKSNNKAIQSIIEAIDDVVTNPRSSDILLGDAKLGSQALKTAREIWSRLSKAERVANAIERAELRAASTGSGGNVDNAIRQNLRRILENPRGFTEAEQEALRRAVTGTPGQNMLRLAGKLSPSGNGLMAALGIGGAMVNPLLGAASLGGMGAKAVADSLTRQNTQILDALIRSGGQNAPAVSAIRQAVIDALIRGSAPQLPAYIGQ